jgi:hypothetical protein
MKSMKSGDSKTCIATSDAQIYHNAIFVSQKKKSKTIRNDDHRQDFWNWREWGSVCLSLLKGDDDGHRESRSCFLISFTLWWFSMMMASQRWPSLCLFTVVVLSLKYVSVEISITFFLSSWFWSENRRKGKMIFFYLHYLPFIVWSRILLMIYDCMLNLISSQLK